MTSFLGDALLYFEGALVVSDILKKSFRDGGGGGGHQTIALSENAFAFLLKKSVTSVGLYVLACLVLRG